MPGHRHPRKDSQNDRSKHRSHRAGHRDRQGVRPPAQRLVRRRLGPRGDPQANGPAGSRTARWRSSAPRTARPWPWRTRAGTGWRRCRWARPWARTGSSARTTASSTTPRAAACPCRRRRRINPSATVPSFPVVERYRYVWVWLGDPTQADPDLVPDMHQMDRPGVGRRRRDHLRAVQLPAGAGQPDGPHPRGVRALLQHRPGRAQRVRLRGHARRTRTVTVSRWMLDIEPPPFWLKNMRDKFPGFEGKVDRWQIIHFEAPSHDPHRRRRGQGRHRRPRGRPQPGRQRLRHEHDHARRPTAPATTSGRSCATTAWTASSSPPSCATACTACSARTRRC